MKKKKVLMIAYVFPPLSGPAVQRTLKFVKYLRGYNWEPVIVTAKKARYPLKDDSLLKEIPKYIEVIRIEEDLTFNSNIIQEFINLYYGMLTNVNLLNEYLRDIKTQDEYYFIPDTNIFWANNVLKKIGSMIDFEKIDMIYTTSDPYSDNIIGYYLKKRFLKPWIADFRDEWTNNPYVKYNKDSIFFKIIYQLEDCTVQNADRVITVSEISTDNYRRIFKLNENKVVTITNGYDEDDFNNINFLADKNKYFTIIYNGLLHTSRTPETIFEAVQNLLSKKLIDKNKIKIIFTGKEYSQRWLKQIKDSSLQGIVQFTPYLNHLESLQLASKADLLLLIIGPGKQRKAVYSGKLFEYLRLNKPILSLSPHDSVIDKLLKDTNRGINKKFYDIRGIEKAILNYYNNWQNNIKWQPPNDGKIEKYARKNLTKKLADQFNNVLSHYHMIQTDTIDKQNNNLSSKNKDEDKGCSNKNSLLKRMLFIQSSPDLRAYKIAQELCQKGIQTDLLYSAKYSIEDYQETTSPFKNIFHLKNNTEIVNFVTNSTYDLLYCSNNSVCLTGILLGSKKPIINDCSELLSLNNTTSIEKIALEYIANTNSQGNIFTNPVLKEIAINKFNLQNRPILCLPDYPRKEMLPKKYLTKLSLLDGEIHSVYINTMTKIKNQQTFLENLFRKITEERIHIHIYASDQKQETHLSQNSYLHYEERSSLKELTTELTKYDLALSPFNITEKSQIYLDTFFPTKIWNYLAAGLPILFSDLYLLREFNKLYRVGIIYNPFLNLKEQIEEVCFLRIDKELLVNNKWYFEEYGNLLKNFFTEVILRYCKP